MKVGDRVRHKDGIHGDGEIVEIVLPGKITANVRWDTYRINVPYGDYDNDVVRFCAGSGIP